MVPVAFCAFKLNIVIVDDHGTPSISELLTPSKRKHCNFNLVVYRIEDDLKQYLMKRDE